MRIFQFQPPPFCRREALRYAGAREETEEIVALLDSAWEEAEGQLSYRVCCREYPLDRDGDEWLLHFSGVHSVSLSRHLRGCRKILLMAATVGMGMDRLILKYGKIAPARGLMMQSIGAERIEALCDVFCARMAEEMGGRGLFLTPRFSPGYGDLPLTVQQNIFQALQPENAIGLTLNSSLIMAPSKSVTAIIGCTHEKQDLPHDPCRGCGMGNCLYRRSP